MADPLSIIASIAGVGVASAQLANKVYDFTDKYRNAPAQMQDVASEMSHLSSIFSLLATVLSHGQGLYKPQVLQDAASIIGRVNKIQDEIKKLMKRNSGVRARIKWVMSFGKVSELLDRIEALKSSLSILLDTTQLALTTREPRLNFDEYRCITSYFVLANNLRIERLKGLITAGVKEIRQCVITLQTAKPALMFEPPKLLDAAPVSETGLVVPRTYHSLPIMTLPSSRKHPADAAKNTVDAMEPSGAQFETASWLYNMTLARSGSYADSAHYYTGPALPNPFDPQPGHGAFRDAEQSNLRHSAIPSLLNPFDPQPGDGAFRDAKPSNLHRSAIPEFPVTRVPPPQRLYEIPVSAVAHNLVGTWTYLNPSDFFATRDVVVEEQPDVSYDDSGSDDDENVSMPLHGLSRRTFTFEDYHRALESGSIYDSSFQPQVPSRSNPMKKTETDDKQDRATKRRDRKETSANHIRNYAHERYLEDTTDGSDEWNLMEEEIFRPTRRTPPPPSPPPPPLQQDTAKENAILEKLNDLLLRKAEEDVKKEAEATRATELAKFDRLESLLMAQTEASIAQEKAEKQAAEVSLAKLEKLILQQGDKQHKREMAADAARRVAVEAAEAEKKKIDEEKQSAAEAAALLLEAARKSCETAEKKAATRETAYEQALTIARQANEETERELRKERILRQKAQDFYRPPPLLQVLYPATDEETDEETVIPARIRAAVSHLVDVMHGKEDKKWYATVNGPSLIDISDGYFARKVLDIDESKLVHNKPCQIGNVLEPAAVLQALTTPEKYHLVFPIGAQQALDGRKDLVVALQDENIGVIFEMNPNEDKSTMLQLEMALEGFPTASRKPVTTEYDRGRGDAFVHSSLLWQNLPKHGQSELYHSLCKADWKPTYLRSSGMFVSYMLSE